MVKTITNCCLVGLAVIASIVIAAFGYYHFFVKDFTVGVNYIDKLTPTDTLELFEAGKLSAAEVEEFESKKLLELNYYSNSKNNGIELQELKINYFTDYTLSTAAFRSTGMQYIGDYHGTRLSTCDSYNVNLGFVIGGGHDQHYGNDDIADKYVDTNFNYYDSVNGLKYNGITNCNGSVATELKRSTPLIIPIGGKPFALKLDKYSDEIVGKVSGGLYNTGWNWKIGDVYNRFYYTYGSLFEACMQSVKTNNHAYGDFYLTLNLSYLFTVYEFDEASKKFKFDDVTDEIMTYAVLKFHYDENGARNSTQSLFGIIDNNPKYDIEDKNIDTTYWQERMVYTLTDKDFDLRYSDVYVGYFASLSVDTKALFESMPRVKANVKIDTFYDGKKIVGIDYNGFENFEIDTLTVNGNGKFYLLNKALYNTKLQTFKHSSGLTLDIADNATNNEYREVVI